jgi:Helix-turn-helix domain
VLAEVRVARIVEAVGRHRSGRFSCMEAAEVLGISERHFRRLRDRYEAEGAEGLIDRRRGRVSGRRVPVDRIEWVLDQYRTRYFDPRTAGERAQVRARLHLDQARAADGGAGDAGAATVGAQEEAAAAAVARHAAVSGRLAASLAHRPAAVRSGGDDGRCRQQGLLALLVEEEGTASSFAGLAEVIGQHGLFSSLYTDRGSHYFHTPKAGGKVAKDRPTQVGRALRRLGIEHIAAYSPEARGRMERLFGTLQGRLPQELRLAGITTLEVANRFLAERFVPEHNARFAVPAAEPGTAFVPYVGDLAEVLCPATFVTEPPVLPHAVMLPGKVMSPRASSGGLSGGPFQ